MRLDLPTHVKASREAPTLNAMSTQEERVGGSTLNERILGRGWQQFQPIEATFERGEIDAAEWHARIGAIIGPAYLSATDPRAQSGFSGSAEDWESARRFIFAAVNRDGTFLDVGCANGHLMECAVKWLAEDGIRIEPFGLEILPELAALARHRLPNWVDRIAVGSALDWIPGRSFDFVRTGLEYVPAPLRAQLVGHLLEHAVVPGGRLIIGAFSEPAGSPSHLQAEVASWGFIVAGAADVRHAQDQGVVRRAFWLDKPL
jgi:SAM-dependent methyltransferase